MELEKVPKIIHQTWKTENIPTEWKRYAQSWKELHPGWDYILWTDKGAREFVKEHYSSFLKMYDGYEFNIERADAMRYFILHKLGGVYADLDMECINPVDQIVQDYTCFLASEPHEHLIFFEKISKADRIPICNAFMGSVPGHRFWEFVMDKLKSKYNQKYETLVNDDFLVIERTGPGMLTEAYKTYEKADEVGIKILDSHIVNPISKGNIAFKALFQDPKETKEYYAQKGSLAIHYWNSTWWPPKSDLVLKNDNPKEIKGFKFYQGKRSVKFTLQDLNLTRDIEKLSNILRENPSIVAFDTEGNTMTSIDLPLQWEDCIGAAFNEGIYVKKDFGLIIKSYKRELPYYLSNRIGFMNWPSFIRKPFAKLYHFLHRVRNDE